MFSNHTRTTGPVVFFDSWQLVEGMFCFGVDLNMILEQTTTCVQVVFLDSLLMVHSWQCAESFGFGVYLDYQKDGKEMRNATRTMKVAQFEGGKVMVTYTSKNKVYGGYLWMPLSLSPSEMQDFALLTTMKQKIIMDEYFLDDPNNTVPLMDPKHFQRWMMNLSARNGIDSFVRLTNLRCNRYYILSIYVVRTTK
jgi:hypothetical protein